MPTLTNLATGATATVHEVIGYEATSPVRTIEHPVIGVAVPDFTVKPAGPRRGRYELLCTSRAAGVALEVFLREPGPFELAEATMPTTRFLVTGDVGLRYEASRTAVVTVDYTGVGR